MLQTAILERGLKVGQVAQLRDLLILLFVARGVTNNRSLAKAARDEI